MDDKPSSSGLEPAEEEGEEEVQGVSHDGQKCKTDVSNDSCQEELTPDSNPTMANKDSSVDSDVGHSKEVDNDLCSAYHKNKEDHMTLQDDLERLELQNAGVRKREERLQTDEIEVRAGAVDQKTQDGASVAECPEVETVLEGENEEATLREHFDNCSKSARHPEYIAAPDFCFEHLPLKYRTERMLALVKVLIKLTVLLRVVSVSDERPTNKKYPRNPRRHGTGRVVWVDHSRQRFQPCPCKECRTSGKPREGYALIEIQTATHLVYDEAEGENTKCYFGYDSKSTDLNSCRTLGTVMEVWGIEEDDISYVIFATHDMELATELYTAVEICRQLTNEIRREYGVNIWGDESEEHLFGNISMLYVRFQELMEYWKMWADRWKNMTIAEAERLLEEENIHIRRSNYLRGFYFRKTLRDMVNGGDDWERVYRQLCKLPGKCERYITNIRDIRDNFQTAIKLHGVETVKNKYHEYCRLLRSLSTDVASTMDYTSEGYNNQLWYCSSQSLTLIVSHPHGLSKQISIGDTTKRTEGRNFHTSRYVYTTATCPGSSGAPVFILGRMGRKMSGQRSGYDMTCPHSSSVSRKSSEINRSVVVSDV